HSDMRNVTKHQGRHRNTKPDPPCPLPKMVIDQRGGDANNQTDAEPNRLPFQKEQRVAVAVPRESACTEKHHNADDQKSQHRNEEKVSAFLVHKIDSYSVFFVFVFSGIKSFCPIFNFRGSSM